MISGTTLVIEEDSGVIPWAALVCGKDIVTVDEIEEFVEQCEMGSAMCLTCDDGMAVIQLQPFGTELELFVKMAVAFRHGAFNRQEAAIVRVARELGARTIAFQTRRLGWRRHLGPQWQRRDTNEFVRLVDGWRR